MKQSRNKFIVLVSLFFLSVAQAVPSFAAGAAAKPKLTIENITQAQDDYIELGNSSFKKIDFQGRKLFIKGQSQEKVLFIGDSNIQQYLPRVEKLIDERPAGTKTAVFAVAGLCVPILGIVDLDHPQCSGFVENALAYAENPDVNAVVLGAQWVGSINDIPANQLSFQENGFKGLLRPRSEAFYRAFKSLDRTIKDLKKKGKEVYLVLNIPVDSDFDPKFWIHRSVNLNAIEINAPTLDKAEFLKRYDAILSQLKAVGKSSGAVVIDPVEFICGQKTCPSTMDDGDPIYKDGFHLRARYVRDHAKFIDQTVKLKK